MPTEHETDRQDSRGIGSYLQPVIVSILVGAITGAISVAMLTARLEERVTALERFRADHSTEVVSLRTKDTEYEKRISKAEATAEHVLRRIDEVAADIKILARRGGQ